MDKKKRIKRTFTMNGERHYVDGATIAEAEAARDQLKYEIKNGLAVTEKMTVKQLSDLWLKKVKNRNIKESTYKDKVTIVNNVIVPKIGYMRVSDVRQLHLDMILEQQADEHSNDRVNKTLSILRGMFNMAIANRFCIVDPCYAIEKPQGKSDSIRREATLLERNKYVGHLIWLDMVILCGVRPGETARVKFSDIGKGYMWVDGTKNRNAQRFVPLPDKLRERILELPHEFNSEYVCNMLGNKRSRQWEKLRKELKMPKSDLKPYCFRHSYVTDLEDCPGLSQAAIKTIIGHSLTGATDRYTHSRKEMCIDTLPILTAFWKKNKLFEEYTNDRIYRDIQNSYIQ